MKVAGATRRFARALLPAAVPVFLAACAELRPYLLPTPASEPTVWEAHRQSIASLTSWMLQGRVAIDTGRDSFNATVSWEQRDEVYALRLLAPLSQGTFELSGDGSSVTMKTPGNETLTARDPQALMQESMGWSLPMSGLKYWVRGIPAPASQTRQLQYDEAGRMTDLEQDGWRISVLRYKRVGDRDLPDKLFMQNDPVKVRLVVGEWQLRL